MYFFHFFFEYSRVLSRTKISIIYFVRMTFFYIVRTYMLVCLSIIARRDSALGFIIMEDEWTVNATIYAVQKKNRIVLFQRFPNMCCQMEKRFQQQLLSLNIISAILMHKRSHHFLHIMCPGFDYSCEYFIKSTVINIFHCTRI